MLIGDVPLQLLDPLVAEFDDVTCLQTDHVVVMRAVGELENSSAAFEIVPAYEARLLELGQNTVDGRQTELLAVLEQQAVDALRAQVAICAVLEDLEYL